MYRFDKKKNNIIIMTSSIVERIIECQNSVSI